MERKYTALLEVEQTTRKGQVSYYKTYVQADTPSELQERIKSDVIAPSLFSTRKIIKKKYYYKQEKVEVERFSMDLFNGKKVCIYERYTYLEKGSIDLHKWHNFECDFIGKHFVYKIFNGGIEMYPNNGYYFKSYVEAIQSITQGYVKEMRENEEQDNQSFWENQD